VATSVLLRLLTPYQSLFEGEVEGVIVPGEYGEFGVLAMHTKFVTTLKPGVLRYVKDGQTVQYAVSGGFAEVHHKGVTVLADSMERPQDINVERAKQSRERAKKELENRASMEPRQIARWEDRLARAENRLKLAK
jgi:F-type H+-transporting ATPase subunit epsilon